MTQAPKIVGAISLAVCSSMHPVHAQPDAKAAPLPATQLSSELVQGIVLNQTVTVQGQEFYRHFSAEWRDREASERYNVTVHERPNASRGSLVWIESSQRVVFRATLPPSRSQTRVLSGQAVEAAYKAVVEADMQRLLFREADLAADEI